MVTGSHKISSYPYFGILGFVSKLPQLMNGKIDKKLTAKSLLNQKSRKANTYIDIVASDKVTQKKVVDLLSLTNIKTHIHADASSLLKKKRFLKTDCLIIETRLDDMLGLVLFKKLLVMCKKLPPTIFIGARPGSISEAVEAIKLGAIDYIEKPFSSRQLIASLNLALSP